MSVYSHANRSHSHSHVAPQHGTKRQRNIIAFAGAILHPLCSFMGSVVTLCRVIIYHNCGNNKAISRQESPDPRAAFYCSRRFPGATMLRIDARCLFLPVQAIRAASGTSGPKNVFPLLFSACSHWPDCN